MNNTTATQSKRLNTKPPADLHEHAMALIKASRTLELKKLLSAYGVGSLTELAPDQFCAFRHELHQLCGDLKVCPPSAPTLTSVELAHRFLRATDPDVDLTSEDIAALIDLYALQQNKACEGALEDAKAEIEKVDHNLRLERVKVNVLAHAFRFLMVGESVKRVERMPAPSRLIVERAMEIINKQFPGAVS